MPHRLAGAYPCDHALSVARVSDPPVRITRFTRRVRDPRHQEDRGLAMCSTYLVSLTTSMHRDESAGESRVLGPTMLHVALELTLA